MVNRIKRVSGSMNIPESVMSTIKIESTLRQLSVFFLFPFLPESDYKSDKSKNPNKYY